MVVVPSAGNVFHISGIHVMLEFFCNPLRTEPCLFATSSDELYVFQVRTLNNVLYLYDKQTNTHLYIFIHIYVLHHLLLFFINMFRSLP